MLKPTHSRGERTTWHRGDAMLTTSISWMWIFRLMWGARTWWGSAYDDRKLRI